MAEASGTRKFLLMIQKLGFEHWLRQNLGCIACVLIVVKYKKKKKKKWKLKFQLENFWLNCDDKLLF